MKALTEKDQSIVSQNLYLYEEVSKYERMVLQSRKEAANAVQAKLDAETIMAKVVAETERKLKAM